MNAPDAVVRPSLENMFLVSALRRNMILRTLVEWWPTVDRRGSNREVMEHWAKMSGLRFEDVESSWDRLFRSGYVNADGTVDPFVTRYLNAWTVAEMPAPARPRARAPAATPVSAGQTTAGPPRRSADPFAGGGEAP